MKNTYTVTSFNDEGRNRVVTNVGDKLKDAMILAAKSEGHMVYIDIHLVHPSTGKPMGTRQVLAAEPWVLRRTLLEQANPKPWYVQ